MVILFLLSFVTILHILYRAAVAILALFTLLGGFQLSYVLCVVIGYAYGHDKLNKFQVGQARISKWEGSNGCLSNFAQREGWVYGHAAQGLSAWTSGTGSTGGSGGAQQVCRCQKMTMIYYVVVLGAFCRRLRLSRGTRSFLMNTCAHTYSFLRCLSSPSPSP